MDVLLVNLTTAMASVDTPSAEEYAALPAAQKAAVAAASKREVTEASLATFVQQGHYVAVLYPAAASLAAMAAATHILMFRLRPNGFTDMTVDLHSIGVISVADPAPVLPAALAGLALNTVVTIDWPPHLFIARGALRNRINASVVEADALLLPPPPNLPLIPHPQGPNGPAAGAGGAPGGAGGGADGGGGSERGPSLEIRLKMNAALDVMYVHGLPQRGAQAGPRPLAFYQRASTVRQHRHRARVARCPRHLRRAIHVV